MDKGNRWVKNYQIVKESIIEYVEEGAFFHGAALSYYTLFALVPIIFLTLSTFGRIVGTEKMLLIINDIFKDNIGIQDTSSFMSYLQAMHLDKNGLLIEIVGFIVLMYTCSAFLVSLKRSINDFFEIKAKRREKQNIIMNLIGFRFISILFLAFFAFVIILFYFLQIFILSFMESNVFNNDNLLDWTFSFLNHIFSIASNMLIFIMIFKYLHDGKISWNLAFRGALLTAVILYASQLIIKYYLQNYFFMGKSGIASSLFILLAWVNYSAQIVFFGAKYTYVLGKHIGDPIH
jgi:membrane protein